MSIDVTITVEGAEEFAAAMRKFDEAMQQKVRDWLADWARRVAASANSKAPERTGYLKSTIYSEIQEWVAEVGAAAAYAIFVEKGTRYMRAQPFLEPALQEHLPELEANIIGAIEQAKSVAGL